MNKEIVKDFIKRDFIYLVCVLWVLFCFLWFSYQTSIELNVCQTALDQALNPDPLAGLLEVIYK